MISKVTQSNKALYEARLAEINRLLHGQNLISEDMIVDTLEKYYQNIVQIQKLPVRYVDPDTGSAYQSKYLLMPLDEPMFEIDANKRSITVPTEFVKNGIGVRGDHRAEVLYFKIDRFFDARDLYDGTDYIIINWQFRGANEGRNKEVPTNTSIAFAPDDTYIPGSIVFGWVIEEDMTPSKGTLSFSISFVSKNTDNTYSYAFNTTIASVNVNDSLYLEDPSILSSLKRPMMERLRNSEFTPDNVAPVGQLKWRSGINVIWDAEEENDFGLSGLPLIANFDYNGDNEEDSILLTAVGAVNDQEGVNIKYTWTGTRFADASGISREPEIVREADGPSRETDWVPTKDEVAQPGIVYWTGEGRVKNRLSIAAGEEFPEGVVVYELGSSFEVDAAGDYLVEMQGERNGATSRSIPSKHCVVPHAAIPEATLKVNAVAPEGSNEVAAYEIVDADVAKEYVFVGDAAPEVKAIVTKNEKNVISRHDVNGVDISAKKLAVAPNDVNVEASQANQDAIDIVQKDNNIMVIGELSALNSFASTNPAQGEAKWVGIDIGTNISDITNLTWNGYPLEQADVEEAASVGLGAGHIIFWAKAENLPRVIKIGRRGYADTEIKVSFVERDAYVEEENVVDADLALANARQGIFKESELGRVAFTIVSEGETPTMDDFANAEWEAYVEGKSFDVPSASASGEGSYCVYVANERNHTYSISEPSNVINVSKIAPQLSSINLFAQENSGFTLMMLENNEQVLNENDEPVTIQIDGNHLIRYFQIVVGDNFENIGSEGDRVDLSLRVIEIDSNAYDADGSIVFPQTHPDGSTDAYIPALVEGENNKYTFAIDRDPGTYVIEATTVYHGTKRVTITKPFFVVSRLQFD